MADNLDRTFNGRYAAAGVSNTYLRNYPQYSNVLLGTNDGRSYYNSLQASIRHSSRNMKSSINYTFAKSIDLFSGDTGSGLYDSYNETFSRAPSDLNLPHSLNATAIYTLPLGRGQRFGGQWPHWADTVAGGWDLGLITIWRSGFPFSFSSGRATTAGTSLLNYSGDRTVGTATVRDGGIYFFTPAQIASFSFPGAGEYGTSGRNAFNGPNQWTTNISLVKRFRVAERKAVTFRAEAYGAFNHVNWANPQTNLSTPATFGRITGAAGARTMQLALRYDF